MKRKTAVSILCIILAVLMMLSLVMTVLPVRAYAVSQSDIDALRAKKDEISQRVREAQERVDGLKEQQNTVLQQKAALDEKNKAAKEALELVAQEIAMYDEIIAEKTAELEAALAKEQQQLERYRSRVRAMEENGGYNVMSLVLSSNSFTELLTALDDIGEIMESDKNLEAEYRAAREDVERVKAEYEQVRADCEQKQSELREEKAQIEAEIADTEQQLAQLADDLEAAMAQYEAEAAAEEAADAEVRALIAQFQAEQEAKRRAEEEARRQQQLLLQQQQQQQPIGGGEAVGEGGYTGGGEAVGDGAYTGGAVGDGTSYTSGESIGDGGGYSGGGASAGFSGSFVWPCPVWNGYITGRYGEQRSGHTHAGIDIDGYGCDGAAVVAAAGGTVISAGYNGGYGNTVIIDHGSGYTTLYGHLSGCAVSSGAYVSAGQTIGYMGSTGNSSGTHCHFEIRINGGTVDPEGWFPGLAHYGC